MQDQRTALAGLGSLAGQVGGQVGAQEQAADIGMAGVPAQGTERVKTEPGAFAEAAGGGQLAADDDRAGAQPVCRLGARGDGVDRAIEQVAAQAARQGAPDAVEDRCQAGQGGRRFCTGSGIRALQVGRAWRRTRRALLRLVRRKPTSDKLTLTATATLI
jgi:hypothetical protein